MYRLLEILAGRTLKPWITLAAAVTLSMVFMTTGSGDITGIASARAADIIATLTRPFGIFPEMIRLKSENTRLRRENVELMLRANHADEAINENQRLRELLDFKKKSNLNLRSADILARDPLPGVNSILLDIGKRQGAEIHQPVICSQGLVGKLVQVGAKTSVVQLILDRNLGAAVRLSDCRVDGITKWAGHNRLIIEGIPASAPVHLNEEVISSGLDGIFPEGIPVGEVISTNKIEESLFLQVEIQPAVVFSKVEEVFLVTNNPSPVTP
ncbi:rod shape-determining protein MreC [candidate division LCP-89 bacterium B3_LCP]|uniref:Cell shape-determining protein MreC n=1 Tax=candidate division LCP-89 bacterium B3_LCP TaxID=2012998 RepID=A0A532V284_UNCL8|nr:MAG: rod shape-determining protein MreC [candidate division LCP-89 bacterium B3_LCP]